MLGRENAVLGCAPLDVDAPQVWVRAQRRFGIVDGGRRIPFRRVLDGLEVRIARLDDLVAAVRPVLTIHGGEIPLQDRDVAAGASCMRGDELAGFLAITYIVGAHDHDNLAAAWLDVHAYDGDVSS